MTDTNSTNTVRQLQSGKWAVITPPDGDGFSSILAECPTEQAARAALVEGSVAYALYRKESLSLSKRGTDETRIDREALARLLAEREELVTLLGDLRDLSADFSRSVRLTKDGATLRKAAALLSRLGAGA